MPFISDVLETVIIQHKYIQQINRQLKSDQSDKDFDSRDDEFEKSCD
jgi:hypothetical protein